MDPNPSNFPILSTVMARLPSSFAGSNSAVVSDFESIQIDAQPQLTRPEPSCQPHYARGLVNRMPHLSDPNVIAAMTRAVSDVAETRSVPNALGERPDHETVDVTKARLVAIESSLSKTIEELVLSPRPSDVDMLQGRAHLAEREKQCRDAAEKDKRDCKAVLQLDELHASYEHVGFGTTILAFNFSYFDGNKTVNGIMMGVDSRLSSRARILDVGKKALQLNDQIMILLAGNAKWCDKMCITLKQELPPASSLSLGDVVDAVVTHLNYNLDEICQFDQVNDSSIGTLVIGLDNHQGLLIYQTQLHGGRVRWVRRPYISVGSGSKYIGHIFKPYNNKFNMSIDNAAKLALEALYEATYVDKGTGGPLHVYHLGTEIKKLHEVSAIDTCLTCYGHKEYLKYESTDLFLICLEHVYAEDLKLHFSPFGEIIAAHCVFTRGDVYFHRLSCESAEVASQVYSSTTSMPPLYNFTRGGYLSMHVPYLMEKSSKELLRHVCNLEERRECIDLMMVYWKYFDQYHAHIQSLIMSCSHKLGRLHVQEICNLLRPGGDGIVKRFVGMRGDLYFYRFFFNTEHEA